MKAAVRTLTIAAVAAWAMAASQAYGLSNGDFEAHSTMGWQVYNPDAQVLSWNVTSDPAHVHGGAYAGALTAFGGTESLLIVYNTQSVAEWPSGALARTRVYIKTVGLELADPLQGQGRPQIDSGGRCPAGCPGIGSGQIGRQREPGNRAQIQGLISQETELNLLFQNRHQLRQWFLKPLLVFLDGTLVGIDCVRQRQ